jgi:hypothetical protein
LVLVIRGCSFLEGLSRTLKTYSKRGTLYIASGYQTSGFLTWLQGSFHSAKTSLPDFDDLLRFSAETTRGLP